MTTRKTEYLKPAFHSVHIGGVEDLCGDGNFPIASTPDDKGGRQDAKPNNFGNDDDNAGAPMWED